MKDYAKSFYKSKTWQDCRNAYAKSVGGLCEECLKNGLYKPGEIVHHKVHLTALNITDESITLNPDNLELLCRDHHAQMHGKPRRYRVDAFGNVVVTGI